MENNSMDLMAKYDVAFVISQSGVTSKNIYVRFHGPEKLYASLYPDDWFTYAVQNAKTLAEMVK